jgi:hypothetical protein
MRNVETHIVLDNIDVAEAVRLTKAKLLDEALPGMGVFADFAYECGIEDIDDRDTFDPTQDENLASEFDAFINEKSQQLVNEESYRLACEIRSEDGLVDIFRSMIVPVSWGIDDIEARGLGVCWSWDCAFAIPYNGGGERETDKEVRLTGKVDVGQIDWEQTIALNAVNASMGEDERELRLTNDAMVLLFDVEIRPYSEGQTFKPAFNLEGQKFAAGDAVVAKISI